MTSNIKKVRGKPKSLAASETAAQSSDDKEIRNMMKEYAKKIDDTRGYNRKGISFSNVSLSSYTTNMDETGTRFHPTRWR